MEQKELERALQQIHQEGDGLVRLDFFYRDDLGELAILALAGDPYALYAADLVAGVLPVMGETLCLLCDSTPRKSDIAVITAFTSHGDTQSGAIMSVVCSKCFGPHSDRMAFQEVVGKKWTDDIISDGALRKLDIHPTAGTA